MALAYRYDGAIATIEMLGDYTTAELQDIVRQALDDPEAPAEPRLLFDMRQSRAIGQRSIPDVHEMARFLGSLAPRVRRIAMIVNSDVAFGLMRVGSVISELEAQVFRELEAGRAWLLTGAA